MLSTQGGFPGCWLGKWINTAAKLVVAYYSVNFGVAYKSIIYLNTILHILLRPNKL